MPRLEDYPYDPKLEGRESEFVGLKKLRTIRDRSLARLMFDLYFVAQANEQDAKFWARRNTEEHERAAKELQRKRRYVADVLAGKLGKQLAEALRRLGFDANGPPAAIEQALGIIREHRRSAA